MSPTKPTARPRQLTMAGWFVVAASAFLVLSVFDTLTTLRSVDTRERVTEWLSSPLGEGLGLSVAEALSGMRVALMVTGVSAAAAAVMGFFVLQRHRGARIGLTIAAATILVATMVTAPVSGGLTGVLIAAATLMVWSAPARDWFAGRAVRDSVFGPPAQSSTQQPTDREETVPEEKATPDEGTRPEDQQSRRTPPVSSLSTSSPSDRPGSTYGFGGSPSTGQAPRPVATQPEWSAPVGVAGPPPAYRPQTVPAPTKLACILTWVFSGTVAMLYGATVLALIVAHEEITDLVLDSAEWQRANLREDLLLPVLWVGCLMFLAWSLGACVLAWFTWRRHNWARWLLAASAGAALVAATFAIPVGLLHQLACMATIAGLFSATARAWFAQRGGYGPPPSGGAPPPQPPTAQPPPQPPGQDKPPVW